MTGKKKVNDFNYINRVMNFKADYSENKLVCITNTKEVLRVARYDAKKFFFKEVKASKEELVSRKQMGYSVDIKKGIWFKSVDGWYYTTKKVYKQYRDSLIPNSKIPAPTFTFKSKKDKTEAKNIYL